MDVPWGDHMAERATSDYLYGLATPVTIAANKFGSVVVKIITGFVAQ